jgi:lysophospholipase L1-like esterase
MRGGRAVIGGFLGIVLYEGRRCRQGVYTAGSRRLRILAPSITIAATILVFVGCNDVGPFTFFLAVPGIWSLLSS